ncbi:hypothetical protein [Ruegeria arenilitoris]|uniref:hypothetical protein n=1 Tax=Ruegeria arenilitoris TaxID=1173585 RepID=UPI00147CDADA|nr:hypothetical protein [Ruegeria arenilitoris]
MPISEALIRKLRELALSGDRRAMDLQRRILEEAGAAQAAEFDPKEKKQRILNALRKMGVNVIDDGGGND